MKPTEPTSSLYDPKAQKLADALGATPDNTLANFKYKSNFVDRYQKIFFKLPGDVTTEMIEQAAKSVDPHATVRLGTPLSYEGGWSEDLTYNWSKLNPGNLRVMSGKDAFHDADQNKTWYVTWSTTQNPRTTDVYVRFMEYSATKVALEINGQPVAEPVIFLETGRQ